MIGQDPEMLQMFLEEANEHLSNLEPDLLLLEETKDNPESELINRIFRAVHSLKGSAGFFGFENITKLSHVMENLLSLVRDGKLQPTSEMITELLNGTDKLVMMINDVDNSENIETADLIEILNSLITGENQIGKKVKLKPQDEKDFSQQLADQFEIEVADLKNAISHGHFLYAVRAYTSKDMKEKGRTPLDYIKNIQKLGSLIASYSDISSIINFSDVRTNDIAFVFLFSSVLENDLIAMGLEVAEDQVKLLEFPNLKENQKTTPPAKKAQAEEKKSEVIVETKAEDKPEKKKEERKQDKPKAVIDPPKEEKPVQKKQKSSQSAHKESLRVPVLLLNDLMTLAGELVLARNQLIRMSKDISKTVPGLPGVLQDIDMTTTLLQGKIMDTRMQPISLVFNKFPRVIRDLAKTLGKKIELEMTGNEVDLDKSIIENLSDPLTHLVRNAVDHGLEVPEERKKNGKNEVGKVKLKAYHEGGKVNIDVIDDGRGINPEVIVKKAIEKNVISESDARRLSDKDALNLIFAPGFSTAEKISNVSGRGVGMDVVRTNIEKLGGSVSIDSQLGKGSIFNLKLPLTLAIIPSLIVNVRDMNFAIPQIALRELVRIKKDDQHHKIEKVNDAPVLRLRNKLLPIVFLEDVLGLDAREEENQEAIRVLVLQQDENEFGLVVDNIFDSEEIVVKSIPRFFKQSLCYSGTTIMGDGSVALILDINGIALKSELIFASDKDAEKIQEEEHAVEQSETQNLLLFENAEKEFFAINLDLIKRIEKLPKESIEKVGEKEYIEHEGRSLRVIRLEQFLPVKSQEQDLDNMYVIIPKLIENPIGILATKIIDAIDVNTKIDTENIVAKGLIGSSLINKNIVLFPDIYEIVEMADPEKAGIYKSNENKKIKILLVEDTPFFRTLEKQYLESAGYTVDTAFDGLDGLKKSQSKEYDLFVVDIIMPRVDGFEFIKTIKRDPNLKDIPALALTTLTSEETKEKAKEAGFDAYEIKVHKEQLLRTIKLLLSGEYDSE